ncbi:MAG: hypothetical protein ACU0E9_11280 [Limimaricola soesokkakensis]|uniref:hypothetical protein n=1 Tax=Limimaricola soesokkakensis TaxID=1343159 RepID=UPI004058A0E0
MKPKKPKVNRETLAEAASEGRESEMLAFLERLRNRTARLQADHQFAEALVALEVLESAFSALDQGVPHSELKAGYTVQGWQENTVEIPADLLRILVRGWQKYKASDAGYTFGETLGLEGGGGQGQKPQKTLLKQFNRERTLSNEALIEYLHTDVSWEKAEGAVSDRLQDDGHSSAATVKRISQKHRKHVLDALRKKGILDK